MPVYVKADGTVGWSYQIQDGVESGTAASVDAAVREVVDGVRVMNGTTIRPQDVRVLRERLTTVSTWEEVPAPPPPSHPCW